MKLKSFLIVTLITCFAQAQEERSTTKFTDSIDAYLKAREIKESFNRSEYDEFFKRNYEKWKNQYKSIKYVDDPKLKEELIEVKSKANAFCFTKDKLWNEKRPSAVEQSKQRAEIEAYRQYLTENCFKWEAEDKRLEAIVDEINRKERLKAREEEIKRQEELIRLLKAQEERAKKESKK